MSSVLFPHLAGVTIEQVFLAGRSVRIQASTQTLKAACPACGATSRQVHDRYERRLCDTAVASQETPDSPAGPAVLLPQP